MPTEAVRSLCLFCGSSDAADPDYLAAAADFGRLLAQADIRLVYGGGGVGLMGAAARACHQAGGRVFGVMPAFLRAHERLFDAVETVVVQSMHERKTLMYDQADAYVIMPGGVGTLEELVELLSWRRLDLHAKPIVFVNLKGFWNPFYALIAHTVAERFTPEWIPTVWRSVDRVEDVLPTLADWPSPSDRDIDLPL